MKESDEKSHILEPKVTDGPAEISDFVDDLPDSDDPRKFLDVLGDYANTALLGFTGNIQTKRLPPHSQLIQVSCSKDDFEKIRSKLREYAIVLDPRMREATDVYAKNPAIVCLVDEEVNLDSLINEVKRISSSPLELKKFLPGAILFRSKKDGILPLGKASETKYSSQKKRSQGMPVYAISGRPDCISRLKNEMDMSSVVSALEEKEENQKISKEKSTIFPRRGPVDYLMIDLSRMDENGLEDLIGLLSHIINIPDVYLSSQNGYLFVVNTAERGANYLALLAYQLNHLLEGKASLFVFKGIVQHNPSEDVLSSFRIDTEYDHKRLENFKPGAYVGDGVLVDRDKALIHYKVKDTGLDKVKELTLCKAIATLVAGGPDAMIGNEEVFSNLKKYCYDKKTKVIVVEGKAGMGKSRLIDAIAEQAPNPFVLSIDPMGKGAAGFGLSILAEQFVNLLDEKIKAKMVDASESKILNPGTRALISEFKEMTGNKRIDYALQNPEKIRALISGVLKFFVAINRPPLLVIDDLHHSDIFSRNEIIKFLGADIPNGAKCIVSYRGEDMDKVEDESTDEAGNRKIKRKRQRVDLFRGIEGVQRVTVPGLNFTDSEVDRKGNTLMDRYVTSSFRKKLGSGWKLESKQSKELAERVGNWPLALTTYLNFILEDSENYTLDQQRKTLEVKPRIFDLLLKIQEQSDLAKFLINRIDVLAHESKSILEVIALLGGEMSLKQIKKTAVEILNLKEEKVEEYLNELMEKGLLVERESGFVKRILEGGKKYKLFHSNIRELIVAGMDTERRQERSGQLYEKLRNLHPDIKLGLLCNVSETKSVGDAEFWAEYSRIMNEALKDAEGLNAHARIWVLTRQLLGNIWSGKGINHPIYMAVDRLETNANRIPDIVPQGIKDLLIRSAFALAKNAILYGQFSDAELALCTLETCSTYNDEFRAQLKDVFLSLFDVYYIQQLPQQAEDLYQKYIVGSSVEQDLSDSLSLDVAHRLRKMSAPKLEEDEFEPGEMVLVKMKGLFSKLSYQDVIRLYDENEKLFNRLDEESLEKTGKRASIAIEAECLAKIFSAVGKVIVDTRGTGVDEEIECDPSFLSDKSRKILEGALKVIKKVRDDPVLGSFTRLNVGMKEGQILNRLGRNEEAIDIFQKCWEIATHLDVHPVALKSAMFKGDAEGMLAGGRGDPKNLNRTWLERAIDSYVKQGWFSARHVEDKNYNKFLVNNQPLRFIAMLFESYLVEIRAIKNSKETQLQDGDSPRLAEIKKTLEPYVILAVQAYRYINEKWKVAPHSGKDLTKGENFTKGGYIQYYLLPSLKPLIDCMVEMGFSQSPSQLKNLISTGHYDEVLSEMERSDDIMPTVIGLVSEDKFPFSNVQGLHAALEHAKGIVNDYLGERVVKVSNIEWLLKFIEEAFGPVRIPAIENEVLSRVDDILPISEIVLENESIDDPEKTKPPEE